MAAKQKTPAKMPGPARLKRMREDIVCAFDQWDAWAGGAGNVDDIDEYHENVQRRQMDALAILDDLIRFAKEQSKS